MYSASGGDDQIDLAQCRYDACGHNPIRCRVIRGNTVSVPPRSVDPVVARVLDEVPRSAFIASRDVMPMVSGHGIPSRGALETLISRLELPRRQARALLIGAGSGYLAMVLSRMVKQLVIVERSDVMADIARRNLDKFDPANLKLILGEGELGAPDYAPFQLIIAICELDRLDRLTSQLAGNGLLLTIEGGEGRWAHLVAYRKAGDKVRRASLGTIDFSYGLDDALIDLGVLDEKLLEQAHQQAQRLQKPLISVVQGLSGEDDPATHKAIAQRMGIEFREAEEVFALLDKHLFRRFSRTFLDHYRLIPVCLRDGRLLVVTDNPEAQMTPIERMHTEDGVDRILVTPTDYRRIWSALNISEKSQSGIRKAPRVVDTAPAADDLDNYISPYMVAIYEAILLDAVSQRASDIHLERYNDRVRVRLRVDGDLCDLSHYQLGPSELAGVVNVIKTRADLNIAERRLPQGGRSRMKVGSTMYDLRIQTQPSLHGEHVVIRLLPQHGRAMGLAELGMSAPMLRHYRRLLDNPAGMLLIVGPTGSGKSTTLSAGLQELADDGSRKVITVEDPIEYAIDNVQQTSARPAIGFGFADAMRSFVRQDPDVILVGEIRDRETALEAVRASQTGHLVLSTLHANDAVDAVQRLYDLGLHPNSIASELLAVMAQRLAKRICPDCKREVEPDARVLAELFPEQPPRHFRCYEGAGCDKCAQRGTRGRVAVVEYMRVNTDIRNAISHQPPLATLRWMALDAGLITMRDSALDLVIQGVIPLSELPRILPEERMAPESRGGQGGQL